MAILQRLYEQMRALAAIPAVRRIAWLVALVMFVGGLALSFAARPAMLNELDVRRSFIVVLILSPLLTVLNVFSMREIARLSGAELGFLQALRLLIISSAANSLPLPGGAVARTAAIHAAGARLSASGGGNIAAGILWLSATFVMAGVMVAMAVPVIGVALLLSGGVVFFLTLKFSKRLPGAPRSIFRLFVISAAAAVFYAIAIHQTLAALGAPAQFWQSAIISVSSVLGAAISITPSGFGVREGLSAGLAASTGATPAAAFAATAFVYLVMMATLALAWAVLAVVAPSKRYASGTPS